MDLFDKFTSQENLKLAFQYLQDEVDESTIPLDPIWRPSISAITQLGDDFFETLQNYLRQGNYRPDKADYILAQKDHLGGRPICILTVVDRIIYQALLNPKILGNEIDKKLFSFSLGNRILGNENYLKRYQNQWEDFNNKQIDAFKKNFSWRIEFDIQTYYENIHINTLIQVLRDQFKINDERLLNILGEQLKTLAEIPEIGMGIPQGAKASHILANAYLHPLDTFINDLKSTGDFEYFRYADDMVVMSKNLDKANYLVDQTVSFLRKYHLTLNDKTKLERLKDIKSIEENKFYNSYGTINETSQQKVNKISKTLPRIFRKIKQGQEISKQDISGLKYFLKAGEKLGNPDIIDDLITIIPKRPSLIFLICRYLGYFLSEQSNFFHPVSAEVIQSKYEKIWKIYCNNSLTDWAKFWLIKVLSIPLLATGHKEFQAELNRIAIDSEAKFLRPLVYFYKAYAKDEIDPSIDLGFNLDDIRRHIKNAESATEKSIYYYFLIYLSGVEDGEAINELLYEALESNSPEIQLMGIFLKVKLGVQITRNIKGDLSRIYFKLPAQETTKEKSVSKIADDKYLNFEGKIAKDQLVTLLGIAKPQEDRKYSKIIQKKLRFSPESGDAEYQTAIWQFKGKARAFLTVLNENKNMNFNVDDIIQHCNPLVKIQKYAFRNTKDINDTLREIRFRLKVSQGELFPIFKQEKGWIWLLK